MSIKIHIMSPSWQFSCIGVPTVLKIQELFLSLSPISRKLMVENSGQKWVRNVKLNAEMFLN